MAIDSAQGRATILIVGDASPDAFARFVAGLRDAGIEAASARDVYAAMSLMTRLENLRYAIVDVRSLDRAEAAFLTLAPRYFSSVEIVIPLLPGVEDRLQTLGISRSPVELSHFLGELRLSAVMPESGHLESDASRLGGSEDSERPPDGEGVPSDELLDVEPFTIPSLGEAEELIQSQADDQAPEAAGLTAPEPERGIAEAEISAAPSLHEAVRMRMAANDPRVIRRRPPAGHPAGASDVDSRIVPSSDESTLSPEEMDALLSNSDSRGRLDRDDLGGEAASP